MANRYYKDPLEKNLNTLRRGKSRSYGITIADEDGNPINVSGDKFYLTIKKSSRHTDAAALLQNSYLAPNDSGSEAGQARVQISAEDSLSLPVGTFVYDITWVRLTSSPGDSVTVQTGKISIEQGVTLAIT